jgi:hypothetical protein
MGRPPLPVGTFGKIGFVEQSSGDIQAGHDSETTTAARGW